MGLASQFLLRQRGLSTATDATVVALVRFRFENLGDRPALAELPLAYSQRSSRSENAYAGDWQDDRLVPRSPRDTLLVEGNLLYSRRAGARVLRARWESRMTPAPGDTVVTFHKTLRPGESCELVLKVPFVALDRREERAALERLRFERSHAEAAEFWRHERASSWDVIGNVSLAKVFCKR